MKPNTVLFSTTSYTYLRDRIAQHVDVQVGEVEVKRFPDGERYQRILTPVDEQEVVLIGGTATDEDTLELYDLAGAMVKYGARSLTLLTPYFAYSTMERAVKTGEVVTAKSRARLLSSIPMASNGTRIVLMDLHSEGLPYYFEGGIVPTHLYAKPVILDTIRQLGGTDYILASTDAGRAKWVESYANDLGVEAGFVFKRRLSGNHTELTAMNAKVKDAKVIIYDDMIRTGGSLIQAAQAYLEAGASSISAIATHGILPGNSLERLKNSGLFETVAFTDTHPRTQVISDPLFKIVSVAPLFAKFLQEHF